MSSAVGAGGRLGAMTSWRPTGRGVEAAYGDHALAVTVLDPGLVRIRLGLDRRFAPRRSWAVTEPDSAWPGAAVEVRDGARGVVMATEELEIVLYPTGGAVDVHTRAGADVWSDGDVGGPSWSSETGIACWTKRLPADRRHYGLGERTGLLEKGRRRYTCWTTDEWRQQGPTTDPLYVAIPFLFSLDPDGSACGLFLDNTHRTTVDLADVDGGALRLEVSGGVPDHYVVHGPDPAAVLRRFTALVGRMPLPPRWVLGYHHSRWGYESADEIRDVAAGFRRRRIPLDAVHLDIDHMDGFRSFTWDPARFADPAALTSELAADGIRTLCIVDAGIAVEPEYPVYAEGHDRGFFLRTARDRDAPELHRYVWPGLCAFPDFARTEVRDWWGTMYRAYTDVGVAGFLDDMNEPAMHALPLDVEGSPNDEPPPDLPQGGDDEPTTHAEVRNVYANLENRAAYDFLRHERPDERPVLFTRAGFAGLQRHAGVWTGDVTSSFEHLEMSLAQLLNLGLSGVALAGADIGGFFEHCDEELLVRWTQLGALYPFARNHSARGTARQEPWAYGFRAEAACRRALELRYRLLPYLYTLFAEASATGAPVLRPLFWSFAHDRRTHAIADEALLGDALLVAPVLRPGKEAREVYLPAGRWTDLRSRTQHDGPTWILVDAPLDGAIPMFARGGSIVPLGPRLEWTDQRPLDPLTLEVFPDADGRALGALYEDDGRSPAHETGSFARTTLTHANGVLASRRVGGYEPAPRTVHVVVTTPQGIETGAVQDGAKWEIRPG